MFAVLGFLSIAIAVYLVFEEVAYSQEMRPYFRGVRDEGMGGAGVAVVDDETSLFINPAGLGKVRGPYFALLNPELESNYDTTSAIGANLNSYVGAQDPNALLNLAARNPDRNLLS